MSGKTLGEVFWAGQIIDPDLPYDALDDESRRAIEAGAQAVAAHVASPDAELLATEALHRFAEDGRWLTCTDDGRLDPRAELLAVKRAVQEAFDAAARPSAGTALLADLRDRTGVGEPVDRPGDQWEPKPAPELAAAMAETRGLRELVIDMLTAFTVTGDGHRARVGQVQIARWRKRAGLEG